MDDMSVFRRFFVASDMIRELITQGGLRQPSFSEQEVSPPTFGSDTPEEQAVSPHLGRGMAPITGTRPARTTRRTNTKQRDSSSADKYKFPS